MICIISCEIFTKKEKNNYPLAEIAKLKLKFIWKSQKPEAIGDQSDVNDDVRA